MLLLVQFVGALLLDPLDFLLFFQFLKLGRIHGLVSLRVGRAVLERLFRRLVAQFNQLGLGLTLLLQRGQLLLRRVPLPVGIDDCLPGRCAALFGHVALHPRQSTLDIDGGQHLLVGAFLNRLCPRHRLGLRQAAITHHLVQCRARRQFRLHAGNLFRIAPGFIGRDDFRFRIVAFACFQYVLHVLVVRGVGGTQPLLRRVRAQTCGIKTRFLHRVHGERRGSIARFLHGRLDLLARAACGLADRIQILRSLRQAVVQRVQNPTGRLDAFLGFQPLLILLCQLQLQILLAHEARGHYGVVFGVLLAERRQS